MGPNGSGKTTLIRLVSGVLRPTSGSLRVLGVDPYRHPERLAESVGIAYENHFLPPWASARDYLVFASKARSLGKAAVERAAEIFELTSYWERGMETYSAGMQKRVMLAQAWLSDPEILLLDEPFSNLDPQGRALLAELLEARAANGLTTFIATHLAETMIPLTHLALLVNGEIQALGPVADLADAYAARSTSFTVPDPTEAVRILLARGVETVTATSRSVFVTGSRETVSAAREALLEAGIGVEPGEDSYDIWEIYRSVLRQLDKIRDPEAERPEGDVR